MGPMEKKLNFASIPSNLRLVEKLVDEISAQSSIDSDIYGKILIATVEAVNNAIIHGNKSNPDKKVDVWFMKHSKRVEIIVEDEGEGFDYDNVPDPTAPENIENIHGRGVFLIRQLSDEVQFDKQGTHVKMVFNL